MEKTKNKDQVESARESVQNELNAVKDDRNDIRRGLITFSEQFGFTDAYFSF